MYKLEDLSYIMMSEVIAAIVLAHKIIYKDNIIYYFFAHNDLNISTRGDSQLKEIKKLSQ